MKSRFILLSPALSFIVGCSILSGDCPDPLLKVDKIDFNSMVLEASSHLKIFVNNDSTEINTYLTLHVRDGINETLIPAFDQKDLHLEANGNSINYAHENKPLPGGYGCPEIYYPGLTATTTEPKVQLVVKDNSNRSKSWINVTSVDATTFPNFMFSIVNDSLIMSVKPPASLGVRRPNVVVAEDSTGSYGINSSVDYYNQYFRLSDFSLYSDSSISEIRQKKYWAIIQYSQENVTSISSPTIIHYAKKFPDTVSAMINEVRISRISPK